MAKVKSEIYGETDFQPQKDANGKVVSKFTFKYPNATVAIDKDGDLEVNRSAQKNGCIEICHLEDTELSLVGMQVWRGSLLLSDYIFYSQNDLKDKQILELGAGVGLTSIAAAIYAARVVCTDVDIGGILDLIKTNVNKNKQIYGDRNKIEVIEYDFMKNPSDYSPALIQAIESSDIIVAADVIYDDELTNAFIKVIDILLERPSLSKNRKTIYVALEKRYVFTLSELDVVAPMYEYFLKQIQSKHWKVENINIDFPQYFEYKRCKDLVLLKITNL